MKKKIYHITTAIHDSRTSKRMIRYKVRERRALGTNPYPNIIYFTQEEEFLVTKTIAEIVKEDELKLLAFNVCADHIHLLLVCDLEEISLIMKKIKGKTSFILNKCKGFKPLVEGKQKNKPIWQQKYSAPKEVTTIYQLNNTIAYIEKNRNKHRLKPHREELQNCIDNMCCTFDGIFDEKE